MENKIKEIEKKLIALQEESKYDEEAAHLDADNLLLEALSVLGHPELATAFKKIHRYYD